MNERETGEQAFTPALGRAEFTRIYDFAIRLLTREQVWRSALLKQVSPRNDETILDVGCGTGTFAIMLKQKAPKAQIVGLDPDPEVLALAGRKAESKGIDVKWRQGFARDTARTPAAYDKAVSSLMFHQMPMAEKRVGLEAMFNALRPGGELHIADYAHQPDRNMRRLFRWTVQRIDGVEDTQPNADGALEEMLAELAGEKVMPVRVVRTLTGAISLFRLTRPL
ncbi:class I SAM-dependent methyltransferase [Erythrobacter sp.]|uniref:class I SAM-dependent methyltransferase n=1 Tax=Erythrobacter sp. TaxID=1042 RepID=UPI003C71207A